METPFGVDLFTLGSEQPPNLFLWDLFITSCFGLLFVTVYRKTGHNAAQYILKKNYARRVVPSFPVDGHIYYYLVHLL